MTSRYGIHARLPVLLLLVCATATGGCAQIPRIDPTGESIFLAPDEAVPPAVIGGQTFAGPVAPAPAAVTVAPSLGNIDVPPVYSDPSSTTWPSPSAVAPTPAVGVPTAPGSLGMVPVGGPVTPPPSEYVQLTPARVVAPVGGEVVLRAGVCARTGYLLANQRVEWILSREGSGQLVTVNDRGELDFFRWPWNTPRKIDNWYAIGATAIATECLRRGTLDPADDIQIRRGEAWVSVASPNEGTSYVTAYSPVLEDWQGRTATATIYWIDAQWVFPSSANLEPGRSHILTTTVTRRTDGAPLSGYIVRYEVAEGGAELDYEGGGVLDVATEQGRASVTVAPTDSSGGSTTINVSIIRPARAGPAASPELTLGSSSVVLTWGGVNGAPLTTPPSLERTTPPPATGPPFVPPSRETPQPSLPPSTPATPRTPFSEDSPPDTFMPPADEPPPGAPNLEVQIRTLGPDSVEVDDFARYEFTITNRGDAIARNVRIEARYDDGLQVPSHVGPQVTKTIRDLSPGQAEVVNLSFQVTQSGRQCFDVTATADQGTPGTDRACLNAVEPPTIEQPTLEVRMIGPRQKVVGERAEFQIKLRNVGNIPVTNLEIENRYPPEFRPLQVEPQVNEHTAGRLYWDEQPDLPVGQTRTIRIEYEFTAANTSACNLVNVRAVGGVFYADEHCMEILPPRDDGDDSAGASTDGEAGPPASSSPTSLTVTISESAQRVRVGERVMFTAAIENSGPQPQQDVTLRIYFPPELTPDRNLVDPPAQYRLVGNELVFDPIQELRASERISVVIPASVVGEGEPRVWARLESPSLAQPQEVFTDPLTIFPR